MPSAETAARWYISIAAILGTHRMVDLTGKGAKSTWNYLRTRRAKKNVQPVK